MIVRATFKEIDEKQREEVEKLLEKIENDDDVQNVFHTMILIQDLVKLYSFTFPLPIKKLSIKFKSSLKFFVANGSDIKLCLFE